MGVNGIMNKLKSFMSFAVMAREIFRVQMAIMKDNIYLAEAFGAKLDFEIEAGERLWQHREVINHCKLLASYAQKYCNYESFSIASRLVLLVSQKLQFTGQNLLVSLELQEALIAADARCHFELKDFTPAESPIKFLKGNAAVICHRAEWRCIIGEE